MKLNHFPLSMVAIVCTLALTACSSGGDSIAQQLGQIQQSSKKLSNKAQELAAKQTNLEKTQMELDKKTNQLAQDRKALEKKLEELNTKQQEFNQLSESQKAEISATKRALEAQKASLDAQSQTLATEQAKLNAEKAALETAKANLSAERKQLEDEKSALATEKAQFEAEKNKQNQVNTNKAEIKKGFKSNGTFSKTYTISTTNTVDETVETQYTHDFSYVSGKLLEATGNTLMDKPTVAEQKNLNELTLDGKTIVLYTPKEIVDYKQTYPDNYEVKDLSVDGKVVGKVGSLPKSSGRNDFAQMRYGYLQQEGKTTLFVQGHLTPETEKGRSPYNHYFYGYDNPKGEAGEELNPMPTEGVFAYTGFAFMGKEGAYNEYKADGFADFANKKIKVDVKQADQIALTLGGKITGNTFEGTYQGATTKGAFYGTAARDAGATFYQTEGQFKDYHGVFGLTKSTCGFKRCTPASNSTVLNDFSPTE